MGGAARGVPPGPLAKVLQGFTGTWPRNMPVPPFLRIDHALSSKELVPTRATYGTGRGSDHRPIIVDYALVGST